MVASSSILAGGNHRAARYITVAPTAAGRKSRRRVHAAARASQVGPDTGARR
jgi:hypothetical protein